MPSKLIKIIVFLGILNKQKFIRTLAKIEYGNAIFCDKLAHIAIQENRLELAKLLKTHGNEENKHGNMLASLADGCDRISRVGTGRWVKIFRGEENIVKNDIPSSNLKVIEWDSINFPGEKLTGLLENFDGMSYRFVSSRLLFKGQTAFDYSWEDKLAFMYVLEEEVAALYQELVDADDPKLSAIALQITGDELNHANYLKLVLADFAPLPQAAIDKWRHRVWWAKWGLIVDGIQFLWRKY
ncbi:ferritin-like domain-containing protein [Nostoc sp. CHAB 5836]|uniref:ferritin-like domain-containing protein n=1 Tax=Nostoc sp. CHAB 5836 TaxID=2780404 RepID=UPI001E5F5A8D|nr:ferritin-like domain-containing protein [Nostoc sp. CHAB 5836]MCC5616526.1 ferritin-like domain-containing protein [Nostoc sp. CHAB 5836]